LLVGSQSKIIKNLHPIKDANDFKTSAELAVEREKAVKGPPLYVFALKRKQQKR